MIRTYAEWEEQELLMLSLPHIKTDWKPYLGEILSSYEELVSIASKYQKVLLIAPKTECFKRFERFKNTEFILADTNDTWIRDYGAIDVKKGEKTISYDFKFNAWGGKFQSFLDNAVNQKIFESLKGELVEVPLILEGGSIEFNGDGTLLTTATCLLNDNRNKMSKNELEKSLKDIFGLRDIIWLENGFIKGDDTDSHIDTLARFIDKDTIAFASCDDEDDEHYEELQKMKKELEKLNFKLLPLPLPRPVFYEGRRLGATYCNFIFINGALIVPTYGDEKADKLALNSLQKALPNLDIVGMDSRVFIRQNGSLHCSSQNRFLGHR